MSDVSQIRRRAAWHRLGAPLCALVLGGFAVVTDANAATPPPSSGVVCTSPAGGSALLTRTPEGRPNGQIDVLDSLAQILPGRHLVGTDAARLCSARNAYASFQLEVTATAHALHDLDITGGELRNAGGAILPGTAAGANSDVQIDREGYVHLGRLSDGELDPDPAHSAADPVTPAASRVSRNELTGACTDETDRCRFPDELIPDRDSIYHEDRNAFTNLTVPARQNRAIWVDIFVPGDAAPGSYNGHLVARVQGDRSTTIPVSLTVLNVTLPATSTAHSAFFFNTPHNPLADYRAEAELGLDDRISVVPQGVFGGEGASDLYASIEPLLNGTDPRVQLQDDDGRRASLTDFPMNAATDGGYFSTYKGLFNVDVHTMPWAYCDEWGFKYCAEAYDDSAATAWPGLPLLAIDAAQPSSEYDHGDPWSDPAEQVVPTPLNAVIGGVVDIVQYLDPTYEGWKPPQYSNVDDRSAYLRAWQNAAPAERQAWLYTSNSSGSGGAYSNDPVYSGFPSYGIDQVASEQLADGWQLFIEGLQGELYWSVNEDPDIAADPNDSALNLGLNGDGTLFYPWNKATIGGATPVPLESIRLKRIREGRQDYELLRLAEAHGYHLADGQDATTIATGLFPAVSSSDVAPADIDSAEQSLLRLFT